jgi:adenosylmethionine-8-amino-7-oxononanoate aminotransferase
VDDLSSLTPLLMVDFVQMKAFGEDPLILTEGQGIRVRDHHGRWYLDGLSGVFVSALGHGNQRVIRAATDQLNTLAFHAPLFSTNAPALQLAQLLTRIAPSGYSTLKFFSGGAEANEAAIKMARQFATQNGNGKKFKVLSHYRGYHGGTGHALAASGSPGWRAVYEPFAPGFVHVHPPFTYAARFGLEGEALAAAAAALLEETIVLEGPETIAAFITEPIMLSAGVRVPPPGYLERVRAICERYDILLIFDEIITGFGRTGHLFASNMFGVTPDLLCFGKGVSGGYAPLSGVLIQERVASTFWGEVDDNVHFRAGHTYAGNPVACAVGVAAVSELLERGLVDNARKMGERLKHGLAALSDRHPCIVEVRGEGLLLAVEFARDRVSREPFADSVKFGGRVHHAARARGLLIREGPNFVALAPPLVITDADVDEIVHLIDQAVGDAVASLASGGDAADAQTLADLV